MTTDKTYTFKFASVFRLKKMTLKEDEKFVKIISNLKTRIPIQMNFANDMIAVTGGVLAALVASNKTPRLLDLIIEPVTPKLIMRCSFYRKHIYKETNREVIQEVFTDFFTEGSLQTSSLLNRLLILLSERAAQLMTSNTNLEGSGNQSQGNTSVKQ